MKTNKIEIIKKEINPIVEKAKAIEIINESRMTMAVEALSQLNVIGDKITVEKEKLTKPLNEALKEIRSRYKPLEAVYGEAIAILRAKIGQFQTEQVKKQKEEEAKIAARVAKGTLKIDTAVRKLENVEQAKEEVKGDSGLVKFRTVYELVIENEADIPRVYLIPDEKAIKKALEGGKTIKGCRLEEKSIPINYR